MSSKFTISFVGDTSLGEWYPKNQGQEQLIERLEKEPLSFFSGVRHLIEKSDYFILNLETVLEDHPEVVLTDKEYPNYDNPERTVQVLKSLGVSAVGLANNHTMDFGPEVLLRTKKKLENVNIQTFGAGENQKEASKPFKITLNGEKSKRNVYIFAGMRAGRRYREDFGFFAEKEKPGVNSLSQRRLVKEISALRKKDPESIIIIYPHWQGQDYKWASENEKIQERSRAFVNAGADFIFGHGPHMLNNIEIYNGGTIVYSIGNFVFNSLGRYEKLNAPPYSLVINMEIREIDGYWEVENKLYPIMTDNGRTDFKTETINTGEDLYFKMKNSRQSENKVIHLLDELGIEYIQMEPEPKAERFSTNSVLIREFEARDIKTKIIGKYLAAYIDGQSIFFNESQPSTESVFGTILAIDKGIQRNFLEENGLTVAKGKVFNSNEQREAFEYSKNLNSAVIKPSDGRKGRGVTVGVKTQEDFVIAWEEARRVSQQGILVEEEFTGGTEVRYLVVGGQYIAALLRIPPKVIGNGVDTIENLVQKKNEQRFKNPHLLNRLIKIDKYRRHLIEKQGYKLQDVLEKDKEIFIDYKAAFSTGGESMDVTNRVHDSFKRIAERAANAIPGLDVAGIDILASSHYEPSNENNYIVIEINHHPAIGGHHHPLYGTPRNVAKEIVDFVIQKVQK